MKATSREVVKRTITLELSETEAQFLYDLARRIGGDDRVTRRCYADALVEAFSGYVDTTGMVEDMVGHITLNKKEAVL